MVGGGVHQYRVARRSFPSRVRNLGILAGLALAALASAPAHSQAARMGGCRIDRTVQEPAGAGGFIEIVHVRRVSCAVGLRVASSHTCGTGLSCKIGGLRWTCNVRVYSEFLVRGRCDAVGGRQVTWTGGGE